MNDQLKGVRVWLTRPAGQGRSWREALQAAGATVIEQPLLEIGSAPDASAARAALAAAETADIVIATSTNAVAGAWRLRPAFAPHGHLIGVGAATARDLTQAAGRPARAPANDASTSEGLLLMPELVGCEQRRIAILGGAGGRSLLVDRLSARGAHVTKIALYQRLPVSIEKTRLIELAGECDVIVVTSGEALAHLLDLARVSRLDLSGHGLVAPSQRVVQQSGQQLRWAAPPVPLVRMGAAHIASAVAHAWPRRRQ